MDHTEIKSFEDACRVLNTDPTRIVNESDTPDEAAYKKLKVITRALNGDWTPDWTAGDYKYQPWFDMNDREAPSGFSLLCVGYCGRYSGVPSRLCFRSRELAEYAVETFIDLYRDYFVIAA